MHFILKNPQECVKMVVYIIPKSGVNTMRRIHKLFLVGCGYTILILLLFYAFAAISAFVAPAITFGQFLLILICGFVVSLAEFMYEELKVKKAYKGLIHYFVLLVAFCLIFIVSGKISAQRPATVFVAVVLYTFLYFIILAIVHFSRKAINKIDDKLASKKKVTQNQKKKGYKSLYSDGN